MKPLTFFLFSVIFILVIIKPISAEVEIEMFCKDTDGKNFFKQGECTSSRGYPGVDTCKNNLVREFYCISEETCWFEEFPCANGCDETGGFCRVKADETVPSVDPVEYNYIIRYGNSDLVVRDSTPGCCVSPRFSELTQGCKPVSQAIECCPHTSDTAICLRQWFFPSVSATPCKQMVLSEFPNKVWCEESCCCETKNGVSTPLPNTKNIDCQGPGYSRINKECNAENCKKGATTSSSVTGQGCCINPNYKYPCTLTEASICCNSLGDYSINGVSSQQLCNDKFFLKGETNCANSQYCTLGCCCTLDQPKHSNDIVLNPTRSYSPACQNNNQKWFTGPCSANDCRLNFANLLQINKGDPSLKQQAVDYLEEDAAKRNTLNEGDECLPGQCSEGLQCANNNLFSPHFSKCCQKDMCSTLSGCTQKEYETEKVNDVKYRCINEKWRDVGDDQIINNEEIIHDCVQQGGNCEGAGFLWLKSNWWNPFNNKFNCDSDKRSIGRCNSYTEQRCCIPK